MSKITLQVPAKINLQLRAGLPQNDGYHDITMVYQAISLYDTLTISTSNVDGFTITTSGLDSERIPSDSTNLVIKAAQLLASHAGIATPRVHFDLVKSIPTEAGLGGGSADAAAALVGCNILWNANVNDDMLMAIGAKVGEDVPFFIKGKMAIGTGYKQPLIGLNTDDRYTWHWVLGVLPVGLSTKTVFATFDDILAKKQFEQATYQARKELCINTPWGTTAPHLLLDGLVNDLEQPSTELLPDIAMALQAGRTAGAIASLMTGSGSTCVFLAKDEQHAANLVTILQKENIFKQLAIAVGPVQGVQINKI